MVTGYVSPKDAIVIGAGIIGATIAQFLRVKGLDVLVLDSRHKMAGTRPSGGHLKPSWFSGIKKSDYEPAMETLDRIWGMSSEEFVIWPSPITTTVYRIDTDTVLSRYGSTVATVTGIRLEDSSLPVVEYREGSELKETRTMLLVVAAGVWCRELLPGYFKEGDLVGKRGVSFRLPHVLERPFIRPWAPYKQIVAHQQTATDIWIGDGTAILSKNWDETRTQACLSRCCNAVGLDVANTPARSITGIRPYYKGTGADPCFCKLVAPRCWVATGAGKSGTIAAGWAANRIGETV